ncbi:hypothetical protein PPTG_21935 [Phytophthora nicotianae INRA-310]|uniref:Integrase catalytic domain-containing protein n=1 Tax=Phytophthora nicotianae (strain INRA-310) TaxID=761204 RepID=W2QT05_PHYN3|nr:hypothetical protein PPTG_21935 [Phytophthora nicotianae INRA-310]ETN15405.1 hypothetical protein PPTG_21935 [Phytophthora nicotianae INRA-310]
MNATKIEIRWLVSWFRSFASTLGDVVAVRVRTQKTIDGNVRKQYMDENYTLLPAYFTWDQLYTEMNAYVLENDLDYCPTSRIRSPRSNVCDLCAILHTRMQSCITAELTDELGVHTEAAKEMRLEYKKDLASVLEDHAVIVMDFSQNLTLPRVASTPSQWYFLSLVNYNYMYDESVAGKETDEVNSMLYHFIQRIMLANGHRKLPIYADNCGDQNKNNFVVKILHQDLRRSFDGIQTNAAKVRSLLAAYLEPLQPPPPNLEKKQQMYNKVRPYVPSEFAPDPLYAVPIDGEERHAKEAKQARHSASANKKKIDAVVCDEAKVAPVDCEEENEDRTNVSKATSAQPKTGTRSRKRAKKDN